MIKEAKTQEEFESIKQEYCDSPSPWDCKNLMTDWLEEAEFFDNDAFVRSKNGIRMLGYVEGIPCEMDVRGHIVYFHSCALNDNERKKLRDRIYSTFKPFNEENTRVIIILSEYKSTIGTFKLVFYWTKEEL